MKSNRPYKIQHYRDSENKIYQSEFKLGKMTFFFDKKSLDMEMETYQSWETEWLDLEGAHEFYKWLGIVLEGE